MIEEIEKTYRFVKSNDRNPETDGRYHVLLNNGANKHYADFSRGIWWIDGSDYSDANVEWLEELPIHLYETALDKAVEQLMRTQQERNEWQERAKELECRLLDCEKAMGDIQ